MREYYSVKCLFEHRKGRSRTRTYEERITVWRVSSARQAIAKAEAEAKKYTKMICSWGGDWPKCKYIGYALSYETSEKSVKNGVEIFSILRDSALDSRRYMAIFYDNERCGKIV